MSTTSLLDVFSAYILVFESDDQFLSWTQTACKKLLQFTFRVLLWLSDVSYPTNDAN